MFEVNQRYANRKGNYRVLSVDPPRMTVQYDDGSTADLNMLIQARIWENIQSEEEAKATRHSRRSTPTPGDGFYVKSLSMVAEEDLSVPGWRERVTVVPEGGPTLESGDRIIYYAIEQRAFFAVATVTGPPSESVPKGFFYSPEEARGLRFYPIDLDEHAANLEGAVDLDNIELESLPDYRQDLQTPNLYLPISEDDFELLAELLTEVTEEEDDDYDDEDEDEDDFEA